MKIKTFGIVSILAGIIFLSSCSPKTSQPCPKVYKYQKDSHQNICHKQHTQRFNAKCPV